MAETITLPGRDPYQTRTVPEVHPATALGSTVHDPARHAENRQQYQFVLAKNTRLFHALGEILIAFNKNSIQTLVLKGPFLAEHVYGNIGLRPMSDLDILIHQSDSTSVQVILESKDILQANKAMILR